MSKSAGIHSLNEMEMQMKDKAVSLMYNSRTFVSDVCWGPLFICPMVYASEPVCERASVRAYVRSEICKRHLNLCDHVRPCATVLSSQNSLSRVASAH